MDLEFENKLSQHAIISEEMIAQIKIKLGKSHRKESDWDLIKGILIESDVFVIEPKEPSFDLRAIDHVLYFNGELVCFTNLEDCKKYMIWLGKQGKGLNYTIGVMPFIQAIKVADENYLKLNIDYQNETGSPFMAYSPDQKELKAVRMVQLPRR